MLYSRTTKDGKLVDDTQIVGIQEHLTRRRILNLVGVITNVTDAQNLLFALDTFSHEPIKIFISSPGGDVDSAFMLYDTMKLIRSPVITIGRFCASAAILLLAAGKTRYLYPHAKVMLHLIWGQAQGDPKDWAIQHKEMVKYQDAIVEALIECGVKRSRAQIMRDIDRDFWLEPEEAIEYGLADKVITKKEVSKWLK